MNRRISLTIGLIMFFLAVAFFIFALNHPEKSFNWSNNITYFIYGVYIIVCGIFLAAPFKK